MARHLAKEAKSRFLDKLSNAMLIVVSSGAVIVLGVHIYLRKEGLVPDRPDWVGSGRKTLTLSNAEQNDPAERARAKEKEIMLRRRREMELRRRKAEEEESAAKAAEAAALKQQGSWFSWWKKS